MERTLGQTQTEKSKWKAVVGIVFTCLTLALTFFAFVLPFWSLTTITKVSSKIPSEGGLTGQVLEEAYPPGYVMRMFRGLFQTCDYATAGDATSVDCAKTKGKQLHECVRCGPRFNVSHCFVVFMVPRTRTGPGRSCIGSTMCSFSTFLTFIFPYLHKRKILAQTSLIIIHSKNKQTIYTDTV